VNINWTIRYPFIEAFCHGCNTRYLLEFVTPTRAIKHCGGLRTQLPDSVYETWCDIRDNKLTGKRMGSEIGKEPPTAGDSQVTSSKVPSKLDFNVKYF
jgi:hypothetical protein